MTSRPTNRDDFEIALICALRVEVDAVQTMFDVFWDEKDYGRAHGDQNQYTVGLIGEHNIVLAYLPGMGKVSAATVAAGMRPSFPNIKLALIVGVCGAVPRIASSQRDIFLGDLIISTALVQYDFGRQYPHAFEAKDTLTDAPSQQIRTFLNKLDSYYHRQQLESRLLEHLREVECKLPETRYPGSALDCLYDPSYVHKHRPQPTEGSCDECSNEPDKSCHEAVSMSCDELGCEKTKLIQRSRKSDNLRPGVIPQPVVHFGRMASGDTVMKSGSHREKIAAAKTVIAFEMEGAGVWETFPSIVMKGVCDYADSHKSKGWQSHAAAVAAAGMKALLTVWEAGKPAMDKSAPDVTELQCLKDFAGTGDPNIQRALILSEKDVLDKDFCSWILDSRSFHQWWNESETKIWWIHGNPGKGKTMMAASLIDQIQSRLTGKHSTIYHQEKGALTYFFCRASTQGLDDAISILRGLIFILINENRTLLHHAVEKYVIYGKRLFDGAYGLQALFQLLSKLTQTLSQVFVVIDGLDECGHHCDELLQLLLSKESKSSCRAKWIITSRNSGNITQALKDRREVVHTGLEDNAIHVTQAVYRYIDQKVNQLQIVKNHDESTSVKIAAYLKTNAEGTFLWAALVCKELMKARNRALRKTLAILHNFPPGLTPLYTRITQQITDITDSDDQECCTWILRVALLTFRPLQTMEYRHIAPVPRCFDGQAAEVEDLIAEYIPFLTVRDGLVEFVHHSIREYLVDMPDIWPFVSQPERPVTSKSITIFRAHQHITAHLLELMHSNSVANVCNLSHAGILHEDIGTHQIARDVKPYIQYACAHWIDHYTWQTTPTIEHAKLAKLDRGTLDKIAKFFTHDFLFWTEILSLVGSISVSMAALTKLHAHCSEVLAHIHPTTGGSKWGSLSEQKRTEQDFTICDLVHDAKRFVAHNRTPLELAPLQLYTAGLLFSPTKSLIRSIYGHKHSSAVELRSQPKAGWSSCLQVLEGHAASIESVQFSPGGNLLASASMDGTIILWDIATGSLLHSLKGHKDYISSISFDPDGSCLASGSGDRRVRLWDVISGQLKKELRGHTAAVEVVTFSPKGGLVASGAWNGDVRIWNSKLGHLEKELTGHANIVEAICFLPCGSRCASASWDGTVRLWNIETGATETLFEGHATRIRSLAVSLKGMYLACGTDDMKIMLCNLEQGTTQDLAVSAKSTRSITFSSDETVVACGTEDATIYWWNTREAWNCYMKRDHAGPVRTLQIMNSNLVVSGSLDGTCRTYDISNGKLISTFRGHSSCVSAVTCSPTDQIIVSGSWDRTIRVWDRESTIDDDREPSRRNTTIQALAVCSEGDLLATGSEDGSIEVWNLKTNHLIWNMTERGEAITQIVFSPQRVVFAAISARQNVVVWSLSSKLQHWTYAARTESVETCCFSPDGRLMAVKLKGHQTVLLDANNGSVLVEDMNAKLTTTVHESNSALYLTESADYGSTNVLEFEMSNVDETVRKLMCVRDFGEHLDLLPKCFSPDGRFFAIAHTFEGADLSEALIIIYHTSTGGETNSFRGIPRHCDLLAYADDNNTLAVSSNAAAQFAVIDIPTRIIKTFQDPGCFVIKLALTSSYVFALKCSKISQSEGPTNFVQVWDMTTSQLVATIQVSMPDPSDMIYLGPGLIVVLAEQSGMVEVWNTSDWNTLNDFSVNLLGHPSHVNIVWNTTYDGLVIVAGHRDKVVELWDVAIGAKREIYHTQLFKIEMIAVSTDGLFATVGNLDPDQQVWDPSRQCFIAVRRENLRSYMGSRVIEIWDRNNGLVIIVPCAVLSRVEQLSFHSDGSLAIWTGSEMRLWSIDYLQRLAAKTSIDDYLRTTNSISKLRHHLNVPLNSQKTIQIHGANYRVRVSSYEIYSNDTSVCFKVDNDRSPNDQCGLQMTSKRTCIHASQSTTDCSVDATNSWIMYKGTRILRIPPDVRSDVHCCTNDTVILGSTTGQPTILQIRPELLNLGLEL